MQPALLIGDVIAANKWLYRWEEPRRGDLVLFNYPKDESQVYVKRLIGLPGETVEIRKRIVYINGHPLHESFAIYSNTSTRKTGPHSGDNFGPIKIPVDQYFVLGDNREQSEDSRHFGLITRENISGKADRIVGSTDGSGNKRLDRIWKPFPPMTFSKQN